MIFKDDKNAIHDIIKSYKNPNYKKIIKDDGITSMKFNKLSNLSFVNKDLILIMNELYLNYNKTFLEREKLRFKEKYLRL
jgi:2-hydroxy-3-keto-5-methylthiopentenyl-1-phosphate phosphatase